MANGGQSVAGLAALEEEVSDEAPLAIWADIDGLLDVIKLPHIAVQG